MFRKSQSGGATDAARGDFAYLPADALYFDSACQSLRPQSVIDAMREYYTEFNSCGERVKYQWGREVDEKVEAARAKILRLLKLPAKDYFVSFTLNTTYGINLILDQIKPELFAKVITSDIEHNSPFLSTMTFSRKYDIPREVLVRNGDGSIDLAAADFANALVVMNCVSNVDGRKMENFADVARKIHAAGGVFVVDASQAMAFYSRWLADEIAQLKPDEKPAAICFSSHKMYGPSLGAMVVRRDLLAKIDTSFIGGGMVDDVRETDFDLSAKNPEHIATAFEAGLQPYAEIIGLGAAVDFLASRAKNDYARVEDFAKRIFEFLANSPKVHLINRAPSSTMSFYHENLDGHLLAEALSDAGVMARSGYFCVHYFLDHVKHYPPLVRLSLGFHNRESDVAKLLEILGRICQ